MIKLTRQQVERQDFVDNQIFELLQKLFSSSKRIDWDIEIIGAVRDAVREKIVGKQKLMSEARFYPYLKI